MTQVIEKTGGEYENRTRVHGFAIRPVIQTNQQGIVSKSTQTNRELNENVSNTELSGAKENAANLAGFNGVKTSIETVQLPHENSLEWAGAPAIILRHFCGVAA
jgi:hypothetical protein